MGLGDEMMAAGEAQAMSAQMGGHKVTICDKKGAPRWHPIWAGNPAIAQTIGPGTGLQLINGPGARPYIERHDSERFVWRDYKPIRANLDAFLTGARRIARPYVVIEPGLKASASTNKQWPRDRWHDVVARLPDISFVQIGAAEIDVLVGATAYTTPGLGSAINVMSQALAYVGHEGGLHHMAAAVGIPAVVLFGGFIAPSVTGYGYHHNIFTGREACGNRGPCNHCAAAMSAITVDRVVDAIRSIVQ